MAESFDTLARRTMSPAAIRQAKRRGRRMLAQTLLSDLRLMNGLSQRELAKALGVKQPSISKMENQPDMQIATLRRIVQALGGELHISARFPSKTIRILPSTDRKRPRRAA